MDAGFTESLLKFFGLLTPILLFCGWIIKELKANRREIQGIVDKVVSEVRADAQKAHKKLHKQLDKRVTKKVCEELRSQCPCNNPKVQTK